LAEGDKVVPSGGNPQLDPTKGALNSTLGRTSGALNSTLGTTKGALSSTLGTTKGSMTGGKISGSLSGSRWIRNQSGLLIRNDEIEIERDVYRNRSSSRNGISSSVEEVSYRGQEDIKASMQGRWNQYRKDLRASKKAEKSGSPDGESMTTANDFQASQSRGKQPRPRPQVDVFSGAFGQLAFGSPVFRLAATTAMAAFPLQTLLNKSVGPFFAKPTNYDGGVPQTNTSEAASKGQVVNDVETESE